MVLISPAPTNSSNEANFQCKQLQIETEGNALKS